MIREIPFQYDLENPIVELKSYARISKIVNHYGSLTLAEEAEAVKILIGKINIPAVFHWITIFNEMANGCDVPLPVNMVDFFRFVIMACFEDVRRAKSRSLQIHCGREFRDSFRGHQGCIFQREKTSQSKQTLR